MPLISMLFAAWDKGNLPLHTVTLREYDLIMAFESGVHKSREKKAGADYYHGDPMDIIPGAAKSFKTLGKK